MALEARARRGTPALRLDTEYRDFRGGRGEDIRLEVVDDPIPSPGAEAVLFDSGGLWRVSAWRRGWLYALRDPTGSETTRAVALDSKWRRGRLYLPPSAHRDDPGFALAFPLDELVYQHHVARHGGLVAHACGLSLRGRGVALCGQSGAGKTTSARLWRRLRPGVRVLSDDRLVLRTGRGGPWAFGTPWSGQGRMAAAGRARLSALVFLAHGRRTRLRPLARTEAAALVLARSFPPLFDRATLARALATADRIAATVPCYALRFRPDASAVEAVWPLLSGTSPAASDRRR